MYKYNEINDRLNDRFLNTSENKIIQPYFKSEARICNKISNVDNNIYNIKINSFDTTIKSDSNICQNYDIYKKGTYNILNKSFNTKKKLHNLTRRNNCV
jgi:hypothetical protein